MLHVYFDGTQIDDNYIYELPKEQTLFSDSFVLGCTPMAQYKLTMELSGVSAPSAVLLKDDNNTVVDTLLVDDFEENDDLTVTYTLVDYMAKFEFNYDASELIGDGSVTLLALLQDMCSKAGVTLATTTFAGSSKAISWYDSTITAREYIGYIAELNGGYACMNANGELQILPFDNTVVATIDVEDCENFKVGEQHVISKVVYDDASGTKWEYGDESGETYYIDINNVFITDTSDVQAIYNTLNGYEYYCLSVDNCPITTAKIGQTIGFVLTGTTYKTIVQIDQSYAGDRWFGGYKLDVKSSTQAETKIFDTKKSIKTIKTTIDRDRGEFSRQITELSSDIEGLSTQVTQNAGQISLIASQTSSMVVTTTVTYGYGDSASTKPSDTAFTYDSIPEAQSGKYIWQKTVTTLMDGTTSTRYTLVPTGVVNIVRQYRLSTSSQAVEFSQLVVGDDALVGSGIAPLTAEFVNELRNTDWAEKMPEVQPGTFLWGRDKYTFYDGSIGYSDPVFLEAIQKNAMNATVIGQREAEHYSELIVKAEGIETKVYGSLNDKEKALQDQITELGKQLGLDKLKAVFSQILQEDTRIQNVINFVDENGNIINIAKTFLDTDGFHVETADTNNETTITGDGLSVKDKTNDEKVLVANATEGVVARDVTVKNYLNIVYNSESPNNSYGFRFEQYSDTYDDSQLGIYGW